MTFATHAQIKTECKYWRDWHKSMRRARPRVMLYTNQPDGSAGLALRGVCTNSNIAADLPMKKCATSFGDPYTLDLDQYHPLAKWLVTFPNDNTVKKNCVLRVDHMGGFMRFTGLLKNWKVIKKDNTYIVRAFFISDAQYMQYLLAVPNPVLPLEVFQGPRDFFIFGPTKWCIAVAILLNLIRIEGNLWNIPPDPFAPDQWDALVNWDVWQVLISNSPFDLDDSSLWTFLSGRTTKMSDVIDDALDDAQCVMVWRRYFPDEGETVPGILNAPTPANGVLVLTIEDMSGYYAADGTYTGGSLADGFIRTVQTFIEGGIEQVETFVTDNETFPNQYYTEGYLGAGDPTVPFVVIHDSKYSAIDTAELSWSPSGPTGVIVGGDNQLADVLAQLTIEAVAALIGYFLLAGFSGLGAIVADVVMPFLKGTIAAWLQYTSNARANQLGWAHLWETNGSGGGTLNAWSFSAVVAIRAALAATQSQSSHHFSLGNSFRWYPGLSYIPGSRVGSVFSRVTNVMLVDQVELIHLSWDWTQDKAPDYEVQVGLANAAMTLAEREARLINKIFATMNDEGVHIFS